MPSPRFAAIVTVIQFRATPVRHFPVVLLTGQRFVCHRGQKSWYGGTSRVGGLSDLKLHLCHCQFEDENITVQSKPLDFPFDSVPKQ